MTMKLIVSLIAVVALSITPSLYGQAQQEQPKPSQEQADRPDEATLTGCLTEQQGSYTLATKAGEQISVNGSADLGKHKDHTVKLTGRASDEGGKRTLAVTKIEMVSASCAR